jgi:glycerate 2-kinase
MRVLLAPQEFKGTLTALEAVEAMADGLRASFSSIELDLLPMADGGPGTLEALLAAGGGERRSTPSHDALMRPVEADWGILSDGTAVIECASASGLWRLTPAELDARRGSSFGTGELIAAALDSDCRRFIIGLGGSATNDGGAGMAQALGFRLLDASGEPLSPGGVSLANLDRIDVSDVDPAITHAAFLAATDVTNLLCGPAGASAVYGPQKGADEVAVRELDAALERLAEVIKRDLAVEVRDRPGAGAAGGLGAAVVAFLGGDLRPGAALVGEAAGLEERIRQADFVLTGEGRLDGQTSFGKAPLHVASLARATGRPVACVAGSLGHGHEALGASFDVIEVASAGSEAVPSREHARQQVGSAAVRALLVLSGRGRG